MLIVSGSNMSGKSTLLRTVGINTVLAMAGAPVRAERLTLSPLAVGATLLYPGLPSRGPLPVLCGDLAHPADFGPCRKAARG